MTVTEIEPKALTRVFEAPLQDGWDGRTLETRIAPYNVAAEVADPPWFHPYREMFLPGAFERQVKAPDRVKVFLNFEHEQGLRGIVGHGLSLNDRDDGLYGSFRVHENQDGDKALQLINEGLLTGLSLEFRPQRSRRVDGVVQRIRAHIDNVSLCRDPAYSEAQVLAVREAPEPAVEPIDYSRAEDVDARLAALGFNPLLRVAMTGKGWDGSPARFTDEQYQRSTLLCRPGNASPKERCSLPVLEPDGSLNTTALGAAAAALSGARGGLRDVSPALKAAAARKLVRYYNQAGQTPPPGLVALART
jgi:HK97 family phage prohead protease